LSNTRSNHNSAEIPPYLKRTESIEELLPVLYLKGISTGDFSEALKSLLGVNAKGLSAGKHRPPRYKHSVFALNPALTSFYVLPAIAASND
jgi:hypothetical protein